MQIRTQHFKKQDWVNGKGALEKDKIKFLLVEGVHQKALESLRAAGYTNIEFHKGALDDEQLKESIRDAHFIGPRSLPIPLKT
ncbi:hypothetical protein ACNKHU_17535 [Shigella flexneri]